MLRFEPNRLSEWAARYSSRDDAVVEAVAARMRIDRCMTKPDFLILCRWKTPHNLKQCASNSDEFVRAVTHTSLTARNEQLRIEVLTLLRGVTWPTASVVLHFGYPDLYPILDSHSLWSLGYDNASHWDFGLWQEYVTFCRKLAAERGMTLRSLSHALQQYAIENEHPR